MEPTIRLVLPIPGLVDIVTSFLKHNARERMIRQIPCADLFAGRFWTSLIRDPVNVKSACDLLEADKVSVLKNPWLAWYPQDAYKIEICATDRSIILTRDGFWTLFHQLLSRTQRIDLPIPSHITERLDPTLWLEELENYTVSLRIPSESEIWYDIVI